MSYKKPNSLEEELKSSQIYKVVTKNGAGIANSIAEGLGKASNAIDNAFNGSAVGNNSNNTYYSNGPANNKNQNYNQQGGSVPPGVNYNYKTKYKAPPPSQYRTPPVNPNQGNPRPVNPTPVPPPQWNRNQYVNSAKSVVENSKNTAQKPGENPVQQGNKNLVLVREPSTAKYWATGIVAILYALFGKMYTPYHVATFAVILIATFVLSSLVFKGKKKYVEAPKEEAKPEKAPASKTGDPEVDRIIAEGYDYLHKMRKANIAIPDEKLTACIDRMEVASKGIFDYISEHPNKASQIRKFMNYYLPTTMKLLNSYEKLDAQAVKGENVSATMEDIERMLYTIAGAFEKQLDSLFDEEAMDIATDISVFESMLKQEGFVESEDVLDMEGK